MNIINMANKRLTKEEAAKALGLQTYDVALPQPWVDDLFLKMSPRSENFPEGWKDIILSSLVWCYDNHSIFGYPVVLTKVAFDLLDTGSFNFQQQVAVIETREI